MDNFIKFKFKTLLDSKIRRKQTNSDNCSHSFINQCLTIAFSVKESTNFLWFKILKKCTEDIYVCGTYTSLYNSIFFFPRLFEELETTLKNFLYLY